MGIRPEETHSATCQDIYIRGIESLSVTGDRINGLVEPWVEPCVRACVCVCIIKRPVAYLHMYSTPMSHNAYSFNITPPAHPPLLHKIRKYWSFSIFSISLTASSIQGSDIYFVAENNRTQKIIFLFHWNGDTYGLLKIIRIFYLFLPLPLLVSAVQSLHPSLSPLSLLCIVHPTLCEAFLKLFVPIWRSRVRASLMYSQPTGCHVALFVYFCKMLYMFQTVPPPIIRSSKTVHTASGFFFFFLLLTAAIVEELELVPALPR
jgi:hypothetical protein